MDAELQRDIRIIKGIRESSASAAKVSAMHQARCESLDRTIARLEALAAAQQREAKLRQLCSKQKAMWSYEVLRILDGKEGE